MVSGNPEPRKIRIYTTKATKTYQTEFTLSVTHYFLVSLVIITITAGIFLQKKYDWLLPVGIAISIFSLPLVFRDYNDFQKQNSRLKKLKDKYENDLAFYQSEYQKFKERQKRLEKLDRSELQKQASLMVLAQTVLPEPGENYKIGLSERYFYHNYLVKYFGQNICIDRCLPNENSDRPFYPDFVFTLPEFRLYIDVEIDEPYTPLTGNCKPKHYQGKDNDRDRFF